MTWDVEPEVSRIWIEGVGVEGVLGGLKAKNESLAADYGRMLDREMKPKLISSWVAMRRTEGGSNFSL